MKIPTGAYLMSSVAQERLNKLNRESKAENEFEAYRFDPIRYITDKLGWHAWAGDGEHPGQIEILQAYELALRQLHERYEYEQGNVTAEQLRYWQPGQVIKNRIRIEAGHTIGKSKAASGIFSHFFDTCSPAIIYSFAPSYEQINDLLWKEIRTDRRNGNLPGRVLEVPELKLSGNHFAKGRATSDSHGKGTERTQGQHGKYLMFIIDEAEGVADFVYDAIESMASGGIVIVLMLANPRTRTSRFYKQRTRADVVNFRISCIYHPNVLADKEVVPNAVRRDYVESMIAAHCEIVDRHDADTHTFDVPWRAGVIYRPDAEFMFRVLGIAPSNLSEKTFISTGRVESAKLRKPEIDPSAPIRMGVDVARFGTDMGTLYIRHGQRCWRAKQFSKQDTTIYKESIKAEALALKRMYPKITSLHVRVDGGGGFGGGVIDQLRRDMELREAFADFKVFEVHNNGAPHNPKAYDNLVTEMYAESNETLKGVSLINIPSALEEDLTEREFEWVNRKGVNVRRLVDKEEFRKKHDGRSPDDGDGLCLCVAPDHLFQNKVIRAN